MPASSRCRSCGGLLLWALFVCVSTYMLMCMYGHIASSEVQPLLAFMAQTPSHEVPEAVPEMPLSVLEQGTGTVRPPKQFHGATGTPVYRVWASMRRRCRDQRREGYKNYGGRGITVCPEWLTFLTFKKDMGDPPRGLTLERLDNNGQYSKENCIWANRKTQQNNRRGNVPLTFQGKTMTISRWADELGLDPNLLYRRRGTGKTVETGLFSPPLRTYTSGRWVASGTWVIPSPTEVPSA